MTPLIALSFGALAGTADVEPIGIIRLRPQVRINPAFESGLDDSELSVLSGAAVGILAKNGPIRASVVVLGTQSWGDRASTNSTEPTAFAAEYWLQGTTPNGKLWLRAGRQELHMLNGFYLSRAPWSVVGRRFDGLRAHAETGRWTIDALSFMLNAPATAEDTGSDASLGDVLGGLYATYTLSDQVAPTLFVLAKHGGPTADDPQRQSQWVAPGLRLWLDLDSGTQLDANAVLQVGSEEGNTRGDRRAHSIIVRGRQDLGTGLALGVGPIFHQTSGHACQETPGSTTCTPADGVIRDPELAFGRNHFLYGAADQVFAANARQLGVTLDSSVAPRLTLTLDASYFQLTNPAGAWRENGGGVQGEGWLVDNTDATIGAEADLLFDWKLDRGMRIDGGLCVFEPLATGVALTGDATQLFAFARHRFEF